MNFRQVSITVEPVDWSSYGSSDVRWQIRTRVRGQEVWQGVQVVDHDLFESDFDYMWKIAGRLFKKNFQDATSRDTEEE
jgi:hypothetical protein